MNPFQIIRPETYEDAAAVMSRGDFSLPVLKAGGMDIVDHLKEGLMEPDALVDVKRVRRGGGDAIVREDDRILIDAGATLAEIAASPLVTASAPGLAMAAGDAATPHVRSVASAAGNLLQRPRCWYYRQSQYDCLKKGGDRCYAVDGENQYHAILGGQSCHIVHPSNLAVAMSVLDGRVHVIGGDRDSIALGDLFQMPSRGVRREHVLESGEVITHVSVAAGPNSSYLAVKHKQSFDWPLVSAAASVQMDGGRIAAATVCCGAVAPVPWRVPNVDAALVGVDPEDSAAMTAASELAVADARPLTQNGYKVQLLPVAVRRAVRMAAGLPAIAEDRR
ncbi:MAG: xanthine dehydrogenase family protein subunit M [Phycisphaerales bacterium]